MRRRAEPVKVSVAEGRLAIGVAPDSELLGGPARVFFVNTLGFDVSDTFAGYTTAQGQAAAAILRDALAYLKDEGARVALNPGAMALVANAVAEERRLVEAQTAGRRLKKRPPRSVDIPGLRRPLKLYQVPAVHHLVELAHAANFSVPGSGKTTIVLAAYAILSRRRQVDKLVVVGPRSAFMPWEDEFRACFDRAPRSIRIVGPRAGRKRLYREAEDKELVLLTYQMASNDVEELAQVLRRDRVMLVLDESHNIKRLEGGKWAESLIGLAPAATKRVILSGTPVPNSIHDLWSQLAFLWPQTPVLGQRDQFKYRMDSDDERDIEEVRTRLYPLYWRIRKRDLGLPRPRFRRIVVPMSNYQQAIYQALATKVLAEVAKAPEERSQLRLWRRARMIRLLQAASNPTLLTRYSQEFRIPPLDASNLPVDRIIARYSDFEVPNKITTTVELVRSLVRRGHKVVVWSAFVHNINTLERMLEELSPAKIYGDIPKDESEDLEYNRETIIRDFKTTDRYRVLIANPSACAESVSLHRVCHHAVYLDRTFNAAHYAQSVERIHRVGLGPREAVWYHIVQSEESIDQVIDERLEGKIARMRRLLEEEFAVVDLESPEEEFSEAAEEAADFAAVIAALKARIVEA